VAGPRVKSFQCGDCFADFDNEALMKIDKKLLNKKFSLDDIGLFDKSAVAFFFMFIIPTLLACYLVFFVPHYITDKARNLTYSRIIIFLMIACGLLGYLFLRRSIKTLVAIIKQAENLSLGNVSGKIEVGWDDELKDLAGSFNRINANLESKIRELEYSQRLTRELFQQIGLAATGAQKIDALFNITVHGLGKILGMTSCFIALYGDDNALRLKSFTGKQKGPNLNMKLAEDKGAVGRAVRSLKTIVVNRDDAKQLAAAGEDIISYERNIVCAPIVFNGKVKGVLGATDKISAQDISPEDIELLESVASQAGVSIKNMELNKNIEEAYYDTLVMLARIVEARDAGSAGHLERVSSYVRMIADKLGLDEETKKILAGGALLHDLGKVGIDDSILKKKEHLTPQEYEIMKQHSIIGENILKPLHLMSKLSALVRHHHERYDGTGYPDGLKGNEIPLAARILAVVDIYDALTTARSYKTAMSHKESIEVLRSYAGNKLDSKLAETFIKLINEKENTNW